MNGPRIKTVTLILPAVFILFTGSALGESVGDYPAGTPASGISSSRHNMGKFGRVITTWATTEICVFCHTPHHTNTSYGVAPLWNRAVQNPSSYSAYGSTIAGTDITALGSTSLACLSCHDGVTTFDNIVNAPGKDGVVPGGSDRGWRFRMPWMPPLLPYIDHFSEAACVTCHVDLYASTDPAARLNVGTDLSNDHPVSVPYNAGTAASLRDSATVISAIDLAAGLTTTNDNIRQNRWAVKGFVSETATIADLLRGGKVECSSCHDPHFRNLSWDEAEQTWYDPTGFITYCSTGESCSDGNFLRRVGGNTGSGVCRTCHNK